MDLQSLTVNFTLRQFNVIQTPHGNFTMSAHYHYRPQETRIQKKSTLTRELLQTDVFLNQIDYKNRVSLQMATDTFGLLK